MKFLLPEEQTTAVVEFNLETLIDDAIHWAHIHGMVTRTKENRLNPDIAAFLPFSLFPTPFPRVIFEQAQSVHTLMQLLYFRVSSDIEFLRENIQSTAETNELMADLLKIMNIVNEEGIKQPLNFILMRADYMSDMGKNEQTGETEYGLKQIEVNIGQAGGFVNSANITKLHRRTMALAGFDTSKEKMPDNPCDTMLINALVMAWKKFDDKDAIILIVAGKLYRDYEQYQLNYLMENVSKNKIKIVQMSLAEAAEELTLGNDHSLRYGTQKVAIAFYRSFSSLRDERIFNVRLMIERSTAIKIPTVANALASQKKIQQILAKPGMVERFFPHPNEADKVTAIRKTFTGLYGLDDPDNENTKRVIQDAIAHPDNYVMKPSREGGGNNFWGDEIPKKLREMSRAELSGHILMQKVHPFSAPNYMVRPNDGVQHGNVVTELSTFGTLLGHVKTKAVLHNAQQGHYARSKPEGATEGGVYGGGGVVDSPFLF
ncbi:hypothetical protein niasHT_011430 [Heterodera trifolii]|uniref:Glutathione synthetase n=1 Tax=Heterodera trifolii TaxID=157864 RepID=A0ABD2L253_9BILA